MSAPEPIRTLIADDEAPARARLRHLLKGAADFALVSEAASGRQAVERIRRDAPELVFLDVQMPGLTGLEVCTEIGAEAMPVVVFVTAYDQFALRAFEVHAVDYLLKPIDRDRFQKTLARLRQRLRTPDAAARPPGELASLIETLKQERRALDRLAIKADGRVVFLRLSDIDWLEAEGNYVKVHAGPSLHLFRETLSGLENDLPASRFLRISRSVIVNLDSVKELQPLFYGDYVVILRDGQQLTLSRTHRDRLNRLIERRA